MLECQQTTKSVRDSLLHTSLAFVKPIYDNVQACAALDSITYQVGKSLLTETITIKPEYLTDTFHHGFTHEGSKRQLLQKCSVRMD